MTEINISGHDVYLKDGIWQCEDDITFQTANKILDYLINEVTMEFNVALVFKFGGVWATLMDFKMDKDEE